MLLSVLTTTFSTASRCPPTTCSPGSETGFDSVWPTASASVTSQSNTVRTYCDLMPFVLESFISTAWNEDLMANFPAKKRRLVAMNASTSSLASTPMRAFAPGSIQPTFTPEESHFASCAKKQPSGRWARMAMTGSVRTTTPLPLIVTTLCPVEASATTSSSLNDIVLAPSCPKTRPTCGKLSDKLLSAHLASSSRKSWLSRIASTP
mmetsp:Transcript_42214/g.96891  ORF Transcript_42214/g.96891 Transcript_42214/m.96891 type:complete len:207 (-) Transcript_42214:286-906(-)